MKFERFIAGKHLTRRRKTGFISLISLISVGGVGVGVMALIVVLGVMSGFDRELKSKIVSVQPHLRIEKFGGIGDASKLIHEIHQKNIPGLESAAGFIEGQAMIRSAVNAQGVMIKGLDLENEDMSLYQKKMVAGRLDFLDSAAAKTQRRFLFFKKTTLKKTGHVVLGQGLAGILRVNVGDEVTLVVPVRDPKNPMSLSNAKIETFKVAGIFRIGMNDFDSGLALISLGKAQELYGLENKVSGLSLRFADVDQAEVWKYRLRSDFTSDYVLRSWYDLNHSFFQALKVEKSVMTILLALIILVAAFNIVSTLTMVVMEKTKDIGILRAIGATRSSVKKIFLMEGFSIGFMGVVFGTGLGLLAAFNLNAISDFIKRTTGLEVFPSDIYYFDKIPVIVNPRDVIFVVAFSFLAALFAGFYPAHRAAALNPIDALRYE